MSGLICPECGKDISIFGRGGGSKMAAQMKVPFLGEIPVDIKMVDMGDKGELNSLLEKTDLEINGAYEEITTKIIG